MSTIKPVCIIGGGYYGCHIALCCKKWNIPFILYESEQNLFTKSSRWNQNRLHQGFHYARSHATRMLCQQGFKRFMETYPECTQEVPQNLYIVPNCSLLDFETYTMIMKHSGLQFNQVENKIFTNIQGVINTTERYIDPDKVFSFFQTQLLSNCQFNTHISKEYLTSHSDQFSYILDCTNNQLFQQQNTIFETTLSLVYQLQTKSDDTELWGLTFVDGPCGSLYPFQPKENLYTLTHVLHTPIHRSNNLEKLNNTITRTQLEDRKKQMETFMIDHVPIFFKQLRYQSYFISTKCKNHKLACDERECYVHHDKINTTPISSVVCCKITGIFQFEDIIKKQFKLYKLFK